MDIIKKFDEKYIKIIDMMKEISIIKGCKCYLVGGAIRDIILNKPIIDLDFTIDFNVLTIIQDIQCEKIEYNNKFQTAKLIINGIKVDIVRSRKEYYEKDGCLPEITYSDINDDIKRRDFTINSIAYDIIDNDLIDCYEGLKDIQNGIIRKLHYNSYREDPTRIFRAIKYANRYGFILKDIDEIKTEIKISSLDLLSCDRIIKEIYLLSKEDKWVENFKMFEILNIWDMNFNNIGKNFYIHDYSKIEIRLINIYLSIKDQRVLRYFEDNSVFDKELKKSFFKYSKEKYDIIEKLSNTLDNYSIYLLLKDKTYYEIIIYSSYDEIFYKINLFSKILKTIKLQTTGYDIIKYFNVSGPSVGNILEELYKLKINTMTSDEINLLKYI
ncbi:MAG: CCA tRNA nucleotidyltransferase [Clostridiaceae bacterium]